MMTLDNLTAEQLVKLNNGFYDQNATSFASTRSKPWDGWRIGLEILYPKLLPNDKLTVLDLAAGNLRFEKFVQDQDYLLGLTNACEFYAVDNCSELLLNSANTQYASEVLNGIPSRIYCQKLDLLTTLLSASSTELTNLISAPQVDLSICFGFMHHIPDAKNRIKFLNAMIDHTKIAGYVFLSFWEFATTDKAISKAMVTTEKFLAKHPDIMLEEQDYIIGWQSKADTYRYCHNFQKPEIIQILCQLQERVEILKIFQADGATNQSNHYCILRRVE